MSSLISKYLRIDLPPNLQILHWAFSSTEVIEGSAFFALPGAKTDGHCFLEEASQKGAVLAFVKNDYEGPDFGLHLVRVENVLDTLQLLAKKKLENSSAKVIGITGSVGKTTCKEFLSTLLSSLGSIYKTPRSMNSQVGMPASLLNAPLADYYILEMGMNSEGHIQRLVDIAPPDIAVITKIELVHAGFFPDGKEGIARAKSEILKGKKTSLLVMAQDLEVYEHFNSHPDKLLISDFRWDEGVFFHYKNRELGPFLTPFKEKHLNYNFVLAATIALELGVGVEELKNKSPFLKTEANRFHKFEKRGITILNDAYNAASVSMLAALESLPLAKPSKKRVAILGSIKELGKFSDEEHRLVGSKAADVCDVILCIGREALPLVDEVLKKNRPCFYFEDMSSLEAKLHEIIEEGDVLLIKGSNSHQLWKIAEKF